LELSWRALTGLWESKLKWAFILAEKSNISLNVTDLTVATEFGGLVPSFQEDSIENCCKTGSIQNICPFPFVSLDFTTINQ